MLRYFENNDVEPQKNAGTIIMKSENHRNSLGYRRDQTPEIK